MPSSSSSKIVRRYISVVSMRSVTRVCSGGHRTVDAPSSHAATTTGTGSHAHEWHLPVWPGSSCGPIDPGRRSARASRRRLVPPRPAPARQPCPPRGSHDRGRIGGRGLRGRPDALATGRPGPACLPGRVRCAPWTRRWAAAGRAPRVTRGRRARAGPTRSERAPSTWRPTTARTAAARDAMVAAATRGAGRPAGPHGIAVRGGTRARDQGGRHAVPRLHPLPAGVARPRLATACPRPGRRTSTGSCPSGASRCPTQPDLWGVRLPPAGEAAALDRWQHFAASGRARALRRPARPSRPRRARPD